MKKNLLLLSLICILGAGSASAQAIGFSLEQLNLNSAGNQIVPYNFDYEVLQGHPYHHPAWVKGSFRTTSSMVFTEVPMKYDSYSKRLAIRMDQDSVFMKPEMVTEFQYSVDGVPYVFKNGYFDVDLGIKAESYFQVMTEGGFTLLKDVSKEYRKANYDAVFNTGSRYDRLVEVTRYIVKTPDGKFRTMSAQRNSVLAAVGIYRPEVQEFARKNRIDFRKDADLIRVFEFASSLVK